MLEIFLVKVFPLLKEFAPWLVIIGGAIRWWFTKKKDDEATSMSRIETLSKVEERLRQSLEKQLAVTEAKLELANKEVERLKLIVASHAIEVEKLKAELSIEIAKNKRG